MTGRAKLHFEFEPLELRDLRRALNAYAAHLSPTADFVPEVREWRDRVLRLNEALNPSTTQPISSRSES